MGCCDTEAHAPPGQASWGKGLVPLYFLYERCYSGRWLGFALQQLRLRRRAFRFIFKSHLAKINNWPDRESDAWTQRLIWNLQDDADGDVGSVDVYGLGYH